MLGTISATGSSARPEHSGIARSGLDVTEHTYPVVTTMSQRATSSEPVEAETFAINVSGRRTEFR